MNTKIVIALLTAIVLVAGCRQDPVYNVSGTQFVQQGPSIGEVERAIIRAGSQRNWIFEKVGPGHMIASIAVRAKHFAKVDVRFDQSSFSITLKEAVNLKYEPDANTIHKNYNSWIRNLENDIQIEMQRMAAS